jgi:hypothetical protein
VRGSRLGEKIASYHNPKETEELSTACSHRIFQKILNTVFFDKTDKRADCVKDKDMLPIETLALLMDAVILSPYGINLHLTRLRKWLSAESKAGWSLKHAFQNECLAENAIMTLGGI